MNQDFQIRHESKHYRPCNQYKHCFHYSHHRSLLGGRSVKRSAGLSDASSSNWTQIVHTEQNQIQKRPKNYFHSKSTKVNGHLLNAEKSAA